MNTSLDKLVQERKMIDEEIEALRGLLAKKNAEIYELLEQEPDAHYENDDYSASIVTKHRTEYDWDGLRDKVGALKWKTITKSVPDLDLLAQAIADGTIKATDAARYQNKKVLNKSVTIRKNGGNV